MKRKPMLAVIMAAALAVSMGVGAYAYEDGTYTGDAQGINGEVSVTVTVEEGNITSIEVGENSETPELGGKALEELPAKIVEANGTEGVDAVAGATITSKALFDAVNIALGLVEEEAEQVAPTATEADVIVVGGGQTGMVAASRAADMGATVILFEQNTVYGGAGRFAGGYISGANTELQAEAGIEDSNELFFEDLKRIGGEGNNNEELAWVHVQRSGATVDWVKDVLGVELSEPGFGAYTPTNVARVYKTSGGQNYIDALERYMQPYIESGAISAYLGTAVDGLIIEDGVVTGVTAGGNEYHAKGGVILATGGYGYNRELVEKYNFAHSRSSAPSTATGSGFDLAKSAGAVFTNMDYLPAYPGAVDTSEDTYTMTLSADTGGWSGAIWVDLDGNRLVDEVGFTVADRQAAWQDAKENYVFILFTQEMKDQAEKPILSTDANAGTWDRFNQELEEGYCVFSGSTIEEVAEAAGIDSAGLAATVEKYNGFVEAGEDTDFGRTEQLMPIESDTYYIIRTVPYILLTKGGVDVNSKAEVLREDGSVIEGLYAGGEQIGGANLGGHNSYGGLACDSTFTFGTIAAESAVSRALGEEVHVEGYVPVSDVLPE